jgi:type I restriction enzyme S subunit
LLGSRRGKGYFLRAAKQTTGIATINKTQLSGFPTLLPPLSLQRTFEELVARHGQLMARLQGRFGLVDTLFEALVQRAFRGEL